MASASFPRIATVCRSARRSAQYSQSDVASLMGWKNAQFISNIERGLCSLPSKYLGKYCELLGIPLGEAIEAMVEDYRASLWQAAGSEAPAPKLYTVPPMGMDGEAV